MFLAPFSDLQNFIILVRTVQFLRKIIFISSYTAENNYFLLYELIQDLPYLNKNSAKSFRVFFCVVFVVSFNKISKFALPGVANQSVTLKCVKDSFSRKRTFIFAKRTFFLAKTIY